ncbi:Zinc finger CCCH domain-containing protein 34 [Raphanus sativus]|nr:Zinc finger CCCH domain-containing protein 34 [Raphanus sativus]
MSFAGLINRVLGHSIQDRLSKGSTDPSIEWTSHGVQTGVEASVWRLGLSGGGAGGGGGGGEAYPERSNEPDCIYYLRTGICGYGSRCRFNHPRDRGAVVGGVRGGVGEDGALPDRMGQPICQHFMRTGTQGGGGSVAPVSLSSCNVSFVKSPHDHTVS